MSIRDFLSKNGNELNRAEKKPDFSTMSRKELDSQFTPTHWKELNYDDRCKCVRELEKRFAQEQRRPAKQVDFAPMEGGCYGGWNKQSDRIIINETLVKENAFRSHGQLIHQSDATYQIYDTVAHEGYHAYQSYALEHPEIHTDKHQLEEWRLNSESATPKGQYENNYYSFRTDRERYRLQALERDAFDYGNRRTMEAFDGIEAEEGPLPGYDEYKDNCMFDSYDNALRQAQKRDPETLSHMAQEMEDRSQAWQRGESCGIIGSNPRYYRASSEEESLQTHGEVQDMEEIYAEEPVEEVEQIQGEEQTLGSLYAGDPEEAAGQNQSVVGEDLDSFYSEDASGPNSENSGHRVEMDQSRGQ